MRPAIRELLLGAYDPDALAWRAIVRAGGGDVSPFMMMLVSRLIRALKAAGVWTQLDRLWLFAAENAQQALIDLKARQTATLGHITTTNASFVANRGFLGNKDGYVLTGFNPTAGTNYTQNNARMSGWVYSAAATTATNLMGASNDIDNSLISLRSTGFLGGVNSGSVYNYNSAGGFVTGWLSGERTSVSVETGYLNGVQVATNAAATSAAPQNLAFRVLADNDPISGGGPTDAGCAAAAFGSSLTAGLRAAEYTALRAYMTAIGVP